MIEIICEKGTIKDLKLFLKANRLKQEQIISTLQAVAERGRECSFVIELVKALPRLQPQDLRDIMRISQDILRAANENALNTFIKAVLSHRSCRMYKRIVLDKLMGLFNKYGIPRPSKQPKKS